jgi:hypothetical protein
MDIATISTIAAADTGTTVFIIPDNDGSAIDFHSTAISIITTAYAGTVAF